MSDRDGELQKARLIAASSISPATLNVYTRLFKEWKSYCAASSLDVWGATSDDLVVFLQGIHQRSKSVSVVYQHLSSVGFFYRLKGLNSPSSSPFVSMYMKGLKRQHLETSTAVKRAKPMTTEIVRLLTSFLLEKECGLREWRTVWRVNIAFYCLLRWDDIVRLKVTDFELTNDDGQPCFEFQLNGGKTLMHDVNPQRRLYSHEKSHYCPLKLTLRYFAFLGQDYNGSVVPQCSPIDGLRPHPTRIIGYTSAYEDLHHCLRLIGVDPKGFSEHSMKRGGATEAAKKGATIGEIQHAGHWACPKTAEKYVEDSHCRIKNFNKYFL